MLLREGSVSRTGGRGSSLRGSLRRSFLRGLAGLAVCAVMMLLPLPLDDGRTGEGSEARRGWSWLDMGGEIGGFGCGQDKSFGGWWYLADEEEE